MIRNIIMDRGIKMGGPKRTTRQNEEIEGGS